MPTIVDGKYNFANDEIQLGGNQITTGTWTPTFNTLGGGAPSGVGGSFLQIGDMVHFCLNFDISAGAGSTSATFTLPVALINNFSGSALTNRQRCIIHARINDGTLTPADPTTSGDNVTFSVTSGANSYRILGTYKLTS